LSEILQSPLAAQNLQSAYLSLVGVGGVGLLCEWQDAGQWVGQLLQTHFCQSQVPQFGPVKQSPLSAQNLQSAYSLFSTAAMTGK